MNIPSDTVDYTLVAAELEYLCLRGKLELLQYTKQLKTTTIQFYDVMLKQRDLHSKLLKNKCTKCIHRHEHYMIQSRILKCRKDIEDIEANLRDESLCLYSDMLAKIEVLKQMEFLAKDGTATTKGIIAAHVISGDELILTEAIMHGLFTTLEPPEIAAILSAFVFNDVRALKVEVPSPTLQIQQARESILNLHNKLNVVQRALGIIIPFEEYEAQINFSLVVVIYKWAQGMSFHECISNTDLQEGHLVRVLVRLDELCRKIGKVAQMQDNLNLADKMAKTSNCIRRNIVFAPSLYI